VIFSRANLACHEVASTDSEYMKGLSGVQFEHDGSTVATNGRILLAVSPAHPERAKFPDVACDQLSPSRNGYLMPSSLIVRVVKGLSRVRKLPLMHVAMSRVRDTHRVGFTSLNESGDPTTTAALPLTEKFPLWRKLLSDLIGQATLRVVLNRDDLVRLLKAIDSACPSTGDVTPVYMEVGTGGVVLHGRNYETAQNAIGALTAIDTRGQWIEQDYTWHESIIHGKKKRVVRKTAKKRG